MRQVCLLLSAVVCAAGPALAQVTVDLHALDALSGSKPSTSRPPKPSPAPKPSPRRAARAMPTPPAPQPEPAVPGPAVATTAPATAPAAKPAPAAPAPAPAPAVATAAPAVPATPAPPAPALPTAPPPSIALAPVPPPQLPAQPAAPPAPPPISPTAASAATAITAGLRVTFGTGQSDLSPASAAAIHNVVRSAPSGDNTSFNVVAYAAGTPEDPSTARRLSLSRALAVRSALIADGISSSRIYVRALGATGGEETPDRVDLTVLGGNAPATGAKSQSQ